MKSILFYWGKGAETRVRIIQLIHECNQKKQACYLNQLAQKMNLSHVAIMKQLGLLIEDGYVREMNPGGKPVYLELTSKGEEINKEFQK